MFNSHQVWFYQQSQLIPFVVYSFLRIVSEQHLDSSFRSFLAEFCARVLKDKFQDCAVIGRDLVRILGDVSKLPEFDYIWSYIQGLDQFGSIQASPIISLLKTPTPRHFLNIRLTPDMEINLLFMLDKVKYGNHKRYQEWFISEYLSEAVCQDSYPLIVDIIRYLVIAYHPPNAVLASPSVQRWHAISWLIRLLKANFAYANAKMALFYDFLFYDPLQDSIMNVEPAILLIVKSVSKVPFISSSMIEFLYLMRRIYFPALSPMIEKCIDRAMMDILAKRVIPNLESIFLSDQIPEQIKQQTREMFPCYLGSNEGRSALPSVYEHPNQVASTSSLGTSEHRDALLKLMNNISIDGTLLKDPQSAMAEFISCLARMDDIAMEATVADLTTFIQGTLSTLVLHRLWRTALIAALKDTSLTSEQLSLAVKRLSTLPVAKTCFNIDAFIGVSEATESKDLLAEEINKAKLERPESFYSTCFKDFGSRLAEAPNALDLLYLILSECDPSQLLQLKRSMICITSPLFVKSSNWNDFMNKLDETVLWDGYIQLFFWDLIAHSLRLSNDPALNRQFMIDSFRRLKPFLCEPDKNAELASSFYNLSVQLWLTNDFNDFYFWFTVYIQEFGQNDAPSTQDTCFALLLTLWRNNSRFFLQCLVKLDEASQPRPLNYRHLRSGVTAFRESVIQVVEPCPAKKSLCACLDTTLTLLRNR